MTWNFPSSGGEITPTHAVVREKTFCESPGGDLGGGFGANDGTLDMTCTG